MDKKEAYNSQVKAHTHEVWNKEAQAIVSRLDAKVTEESARIEVTKQSIGAVALALAVLQNRKSDHTYHVERLPNTCRYYIIRYSTQIKFNL